MNILKVSTNNRDEVSFQFNRAGDLELFHVKRDNSNPHGLSNKPAGAPIDALVATIKQSEVQALKSFFAQL